MAITPRSFFRSPLLMFGLLMVGAVMFLLGQLAMNSLVTCNLSSPVVVYEVEKVEAPVDTCIPDVSRSEWSQLRWFNMIQCLGQNDRIDEAIHHASVALTFHPRSELLYNEKGYWEIVGKRYSDAVSTLNMGLAAIGQPTSHMMENNLAWAGLWEPEALPPNHGRTDTRLMSLDRARTLYQSALEKAPTNCATLHTGLFVEYGIAMYRPQQRANAVDRYMDLRQRYRQCEGQLASDQQAHTVHELLGAAIMDSTLPRYRGHVTTNSTVSNAQLVNQARAGNQLFIRTMKAAHNLEEGFDLADVCREASPLRALQVECHRLAHRTECASSRASR